MCFIDSSVNVDIDPGQITGVQYVCRECKNKFKGLGKKVSCPACGSIDLEKF